MDEVVWKGFGIQMHDQNKNNDLKNFLPVVRVRPEDIEEVREKEGFQNEVPVIGHPIEHHPGEEGWGKEGFQHEDFIIEHHPIEHYQKKSNPLDPWHSRPLDVHRWSEHRELVGLVERIWDAHCSDLDRQKRGGPKPRQSLKGQLRVLLLDLYVVWLEDPTLCLGVSMNSRAWATGSRYNALRLSKKLPVLIGRLGDAGLIEMARGSSVITKA